MTSVTKEYEIITKTLQEWLQLKMTFLLGLGGEGGGGEEFFQVGGAMSEFWAGGRTPPSPQ